MSISDTFTNSAYKNAIDLATGNIKGDISLAQTGVDEAYPGVATIVQLTDSTGGTVGDTINDTTASVKDDLACLAGKINEILVALEAYGITT